MRFQTYRVTIHNWKKHNSLKKRGHRYFMLEHRFFDDDKVSQLKPIETLLFIKLLAIAGDLLSGQFVVTAGLLPRQWRVNDKSLLNHLNSLQQNQILTYEIFTPSMNRIDRSREDVSGNGDPPTAPLKNFNEAEGHNTDPAAKRPVPKPELQAPLAKVFSDFCVEQFGDTGLGMKAGRVVKAFHTVEQFETFVNEIQDREKFRSLPDRKTKKNYLMAALEREMKDRGV